jgi:hypothetical protein
MFDPRYEAQVRLLLRCIPEISRHPCFALKGGTDINLVCKGSATHIRGHRFDLPASEAQT